MTAPPLRPPRPRREPALSLLRLLDPAVLADPYPLHRELREHAPVFWDRYLGSWVVTRYAEAVEVLSTFSAARMPRPEALDALGMAPLRPIAEQMVRQLIFLDPPEHRRVRGLAAAAFTPRRVEHLRTRVQEITDALLDDVVADGRADLIGDLAAPLPAMVTATMLGVPVADHAQLTAWSVVFAEMLGNFQHNPGRTPAVLDAVAEMDAYFRGHLRTADGLLRAMTEAEVGGERLTDDDVVANAILVMTAGLETTVNLIGNSVLTLLRHPAVLARLVADPGLTPVALEELMRYESPSQHTARIAPADVELGGQTIRAGQSVVVLVAAANRDPDRFADPDSLDLDRADNRHVAFGWSTHFCFGAPLARMEGDIALRTVLRRLPGLALAPGPLTWRPNMGLRGLAALPVTFRS